MAGGGIGAARSVREGASPKGSWGEWRCWFSRSRGRMRSASVMTMCLPWRAMWKPASSSARTDEVQADDGEDGAFGRKGVEWETSVCRSGSCGNRLPVGRHLPAVRMHDSVDHAGASGTWSSAPSASSEHWNRTATGGRTVIASIVVLADCAAAGARRIEMGEAMAGWDVWRTT